jgi:hypothetical protein
MMTAMRFQFQDSRCEVLFGHYNIRKNKFSHATHSSFWTTRHIQSQYKRRGKESSTRRGRTCTSPLNRRMTCVMRFTTTFSHASRITSATGIHNRIARSIFFTFFLRYYEPAVRVCTYVSTRNENMPRWNNTFFIVLFVSDISHVSWQLNRTARASMTVVTPMSEN